MTPEPRTGTLHGVGVGPGDPELVTRRATRIVSGAGVVAYVVDEGGRSLARGIVAELIPEGAVELPLHFPMSPARDVRLHARREAARLVLDRLRTGDDVVFVTEGDPLLYSSFQHLLAQMPSGVPVRVCPGVSSLTAAAAEAVLPLVIEDERLLVATAADVLDDLPAWLGRVDTLVIYKVHRHVARLVEALRDIGSLGEAVLVERATQDGASCTTLADWAGEPVPYLSLVIARGSR